LGPYYRRVIDAFEAGRLEEAQEIQFLATRIVHAILKFGGHNAIKASMSVLGAEVGPPRLPIAALSPSAIAELTQGLTNLGALRKEASE
jgi:dihydrodipicolinate synthase/N-acetylneuraminate lyase